MTTKNKKSAAYKVKPVNMKAIRFHLTGTTPLVQRPISLRYESEAPFFQSSKGWFGIPCKGIKSALFAAMKIEKVKMSKTSFVGGMFAVLPDGHARVESTPLVRITGKARDSAELGSKMAGGRLFYAGWEADVVIRFDADRFEPAQVVKLMTVAGEKTGIGLIRPDAHRRRKAGHDFSYGTFSVSVL